MGALPGPLPALTGATKGPGRECQAAEEGGERAIAVSGCPANLPRMGWRERRSRASFPCEIRYRGSLAPGEGGDDL